MRSAASIHKEIVLEDHLAARLMALQGYEERQPEDYDRSLAMDRGLVLRFLRATQPDEWLKLEAQYAGAAEAELFKQLEKGLKERGTLDVLRQGIKLIPGIQLRFLFPPPASGLNPQLVELYEANTLSLIRQVRYSLKNENAIDMVLFVNGLPVATLELKNTLTGSTFRNAEKQYRDDRPPAGEPLLTFKRGALVHFALDQDNVSMTTRLANGKTRFLPFNRGHDGGAGNPDISGEFRVAYLYATENRIDDPMIPAVFSREVWLTILSRFLHLDRGEDSKKGKKPEALIFPRFQQLDAVLKLMEHARAFGAGQNYLIQHSAGSGKSNTIGWTAHQVINLHDATDQPIFDSAIIVTDRIVLDKQLQNTVGQFEQTKGVVKKIDGTSRQLKAAVEGGARIIITTIQKFGTEHLKMVSGQRDRRFAIFIDEAHGSQSGKTAQALTDALTREADSGDDVEAIIAEHQRSRGPQSNISTFAFTATPRNVTLERFGTLGPGGKPRPFHLYSMRQAIEEGFILDVLQNYITYETYYRLEKAVEKDPRFKTKKAQRKVAKFAHLHPTAIGQKVEVIVEHFRRHVMAELNNEAKAMVVTASREAALKYYFGIKGYIEREKYTDIKALVAFSGELEHDGQTWTESELNGFSEIQLPEKFDEDDGYRLLIVAEKYQTGFDQPKLCAMYIDRPLAGLQAVQTLSRLNRTMAGKDKTFILDFKNTADAIRESFKPFFEESTLEDTSDPNQIYALEGRIKKFQIIDDDEVNRFAQVYFAGPLSTADRIKLEGLVREAVKRFELEDDEGKQEEFRQLLKSFMRFYAFVAQIVTLGDSALEKLYAYVSWLVRLLPDREVPADIEITEDMLRLQAIRVTKAAEGKASLNAGETLPLSPISNFGARPYTQEEEKSLSEIIDGFNQRHGTQFSQEDFLRFERVNQEILDQNMRDMLRNNPPDVVFSAFSQAFFKGAIKLFQRDTDMKNIILTDPQAREQAIHHFFKRAMHEARDGG